MNTIQTFIFSISCISLCNFGFSYTIPWQNFDPKEVYENYPDVMPCVYFSDSQHLYQAAYVVHSHRCPCLMPKDETEALPSE